MPGNRKLIAKLVFDLVATLLVGLPFFLLYFIGDPYVRGFYCDDESIRYPFKESTISSSLLFSVSILSSLVVIITTEYMSLPGMKMGRGVSQPIGQFLWVLYQQLIVFAFGALASQTLTDVAKYTIGRQRPHFWDVCQPYGTTCDNTGNRHTYEYQTDYKCVESDRLRDARLSFMSGHSSFSAYCAVYIAIYLQNRVKSPRLALPRAFLQVLFIYLSIYTGFTRISDYKHHWSDVLIGLLQGSLVAILTARFVAYLFNFNGLVSVGAAEETASVGESLQKQNKARNFSTFEVDHGPA